MSEDKVTDVNLLPAVSSQYMSSLLEGVKGHLNKAQWLDEDSKYALRLLMFQGYSAQDVAKVTEFSPNAIRIIAHRYRDALKEEYGESLYS